MLHEGSLGQIAVWRLLHRMRFAACVDELDIHGRLPLWPFAYATKTGPALWTADWKEYASRSYKEPKRKLIHKRGDMLIITYTYSVKGVDEPGYYATVSIDDVTYTNGPSICVYEAQIDCKDGHACKWGEGYTQVYDHLLTKTKLTQIWNRYRAAFLESEVYARPGL